jgi:hypothetical protein
MANAKKKVKHLEVDVETHTMFKTQAAQAGLKLKDYMKLCAIACKSDKKD